MSQVYVSVQTENFSLDAENTQLVSMNHASGAIANFTGVVRGAKEGPELLEMVLEHYPGMTELTITERVQRAVERWSLTSARVIHRIGPLKPGDNIVYVGVAAAHRQAAFDGCAYIMDFLKTEAPFWKKERFEDGTSGWVSSRESDASALNKWK